MSYYLYNLLAMHPYPVIKEMIKKSSALVCSNPCISPQSHMASARDTQPTAFCSTVNHIRLKAPIGVVNTAVSFLASQDFCTDGLFHACEAVPITSTCPLSNSTFHHLRDSILRGCSSPPALTLHWPCQWNPSTSRQSAGPHNLGPSQMPKPCTSLERHLRDFSKVTCSCPTE